MIIIPLPSPHLFFFVFFLFFVFCFYFRGQRREKKPTNKTVPVTSYFAEEEITKRRAAKEAFTSAVSNPLSVDNLLIF